MKKLHQRSKDWGIRAALGSIAAFLLIAVVDSKICTLGPKGEPLDGPVHALLEKAMAVIAFPVVVADFLGVPCTAPFIIPIQIATPVIWGVIAIIISEMLSRRATTHHGLQTR